MSLEVCQLVEVTVVSSLASRDHLREAWTTKSEEQGRAKKKIKGSQGRRVDEIRSIWGGKGTGQKRDSNPSSEADKYMWKRFENIWKTWNQPQGGEY